jgi:hypothetical protein
MKPQLLIQDLNVVGRNNANAKRVRERLEKAGSWKKQRIIRLKPADHPRVEKENGKEIWKLGIAAKVADTHENLIYPPNNGAVRMLALGMEVGAAYSTSIEQILAHPVLSTWEYLLTIEHDNMPEQDSLLRLVQRMEENPKLDCISGLYYTKGELGVPQIWGDPKDPILNFRPQLPDLKGGLVECCGVGMGFALWRLKMFKDKKLRRPWFLTQTRDGVATQDLYFWTDARKYGYRCAVDCSVRIGHYDAETDTVY